MKNNQRFLTAAQAKALDSKALEKFGIPTLVLMENASQAVARAAFKILKNKPVKVAVFCGLGNNGGDGFCAARHLLVAGFKPQIYLAGKASDVKNEARINLAMLLKLKQKIIELKLTNLKAIKSAIKNSGLIIDALLGVGAQGQIRPLYQKTIDLINASGIYVLAVDIPSGLDATTGKVAGRCIKANQTITFVAKKRGMVQPGAKKYCGRILVSTIGLPSNFLF